ncbi:NUDIX domain-containing protein [Dichotomicrobium thermohalophilum]|uniref:8-oxo-dGTP diphosphatase n=1 Tax=Dichotomicrobium thermohalophilum TaxID=933063 RepID=A0A397PH19_9HYPH|nr:NUDIX hydrolase [Dichotomicrobium thermohalophilum]RIA47793.1 8-oxo-dGTP diphosphatase [Dichotomicrobium thermohalophilum]
MSYTYDHPRMAVTVDVALFANGEAPEVLLVRRGKPPFEGTWALPGGFVGIEERVVDAAARELAEETGVSGIPLGFLGYFDAIDRDPRGRTLSLAFWGRADKRAAALRANDDAADAGWFLINELPRLAFDHDRIISEALQAFRAARV